MSRLLFVDTETGGLDPEKHSLLSIGVVVWDSYDGIVFGRELHLKNDVICMTEEAQKVNGITERFEDEMTAEDIITEITDIKNYFFGGETVRLAGHNTQFDVAFLKKMFKDAGEDFESIFGHRFVDTYSILKFLQDIDYVEKDISSSDKAFEYFEIEVNGRHTALGDALATAMLYQKMISFVKGDENNE